MRYRKFWMTNGNGQTIQFTEPSSNIFLNNPTGLGITNTITSNVYPNQLTVLTREQAFGTIGGEMLFYDVENADRYSQYNDFITFLTYKPLTLYYQIPTSTPKTYSIDVDVLSFDKTEVKRDAILRCSFQLQTLSRWKSDEITVTGTGNTYTLTNDGHIPVGFEITINGTSMRNPYFTLTQNGEVYGEAKFTRTISTLTVNSNDGKNSLDVGGLGNPAEYQDLSISNGAMYVTFVKLARGESTLTIGMDSGSVSDVTIKYTPMYRSV